MWPNGAPAVPTPDREYKTKMRTRVAAKLLMLCSIPGKKITFMNKSIFNIYNDSSNCLFVH